MRIWCVPSATELESPKLPPRIDRDVYLRSPPPPPRLSKEQKLARGVIVVNKAKQRKLRKASSSSSSKSTLDDSGHKTNLSFGRGKYAMYFLSKFFWKIHLFHGKQELRVRAKIFQKQLKMTFSWFKGWNSFIIHQFWNSRGFCRLAEEKCGNFFGGWQKCSIL